MRILLSEIDLIAAMIPSEVSVGDVVYPPGGRYGPHSQREVQLLIVYSGSTRVWVDDRPAVTIPAEWVGLLLPGHRVLCAFADESPTHHGWIEFPVEDAESVLDRLEALPAMLPTSRALAVLATEAIAVASTPFSTMEPLVAALSAAAVLRYVGEAESRVRGGDDTIERAQRYLHDHVSDPHVDLQQIAQAVHVSASHLVRRFRAEIGVTPMAYLWHQRVATGVDLLRSTGLPVGEVAVRCGFSSVYHFSRRVKSQTGLSPTELRRRWVEGEEEPRRGSPGRGRRSPPAG
jgi:AraC family transcriptional regulator of arabinose operon